MSFTYQTYQIALAMHWVAIILFFIIYRRRDKHYIYSNFFPSHAHLVFTITLAISAAVLVNGNMATFCVPVPWVNYLLGLVVLWLFIHPIGVFSTWVEKNNIHWLNDLIAGLAGFVSIYLILFGAYEYLMFCIFNLIITAPVFIITRWLNKRLKTSVFSCLNFYGIVIYLPFIVLLLTLTNMKFWNWRRKMTYFMPSIFFVLISIVGAIQIGNIYHHIIENEYRQASVDKFKRNVIQGYFLERALGTHWIYHTRICLDDGYRPPYHDPILVMSRLFYFGPDIFTEDRHINPLRRHLNYNEMHKAFPDRTALYQYAFPEKEIPVNCRCIWLSDYIEY